MQSTVKNENTLEATLGYFEGSAVNEIVSSASNFSVCVVVPPLAAGTLFGVTGNKSFVAAFSFAAAYPAILTVCNPYCWQHIYGWK